MLSLVVDAQADCSAAFQLLTAFALVHAIIIQV